VDISLLGSLEVVDDSGTAVVVSGAKLRALLAILALRAGQVVSADRLVSDLWGDEPPAAAINSLQVLVSKLRRAMPPGTVATRAPGYLLDVPADTVDVSRFARFVREGRAASAAGEFERAAHLFREASGLWRGEALAEFVYEEFAQAEIARLREERSSVFEDRVDAELAGGRHGELVGELDEAVTTEPLRERRRAQLMLALYRSGRQADALRQFQECRQVLSEELGVDPGPELRRLEAAILIHDDDLAAPASRAAPPRRVDRPRTNLRVPPTTTLGRDDQLVTLAALTFAHRLVTMVGPGGAGKTRLAIEVGLKIHERFRDGAWMVELGQFRDPADVVSAIAATLGIADLQTGAAGSGPALARLAEVLAEQELLLVLDNCEHLIDEAARVTEDLRATCPQLHVLATSREGLGLPGEVLWPTPPLSLDHAVDLFAARATESVPGFTLTEETRPAMMEICARLDGMPLAVELAAARVRAFPVAQIAARLDDRFRLLTRGARTGAARQQTLRAVVDWSYDLLFEDEQRLFNRLSIFVEGYDLDAVESVCGDDTLPASEVADLLTRLVDKSLVVARSDDGLARFSMLETLSQYGRERLAASGELDAVRTRHAAWYGSLASRGLAALWGRRQRQWFTRVTRELGNLGLALESAVAENDAELAQTIAGGLGGYWWIRGHPDLGVRWIDSALGCKGPVQAVTRCWALMWAGFLGVLAGRPSHSLALMEEAMQGFEEGGELGRLGFAKFLALQVYATTGAGERVSGLAAESRDIFEAISDQDPVSEFCALFCKGFLAQIRGDDDAALGHLRASLELPALTSDHARILVLCHLADISEAQGRFQEAVESLDLARQLAQGLAPGYDVAILARLSNLALLGQDENAADRLRAEAVDAARHVGCDSVLAETFVGIASRQLRVGRVDAAVAAIAPALVLYREADDAAGSALALITLGWASERRGDAPSAASYLARAYLEARRASDSRSSREAVEGLAGVALLEEDPARAGRLLGLATGLHARAADGSLDTPTVTGVIFLSRVVDPGSVERVERAVRERLGHVDLARAMASADESDLAGIDQLGGRVTAG
jgi:predicted ATPase/DNA-binding SARP family transcriptional activator